MVQTDSCEPLFFLPFLGALHPGTTKQHVPRSTSERIIAPSGRGHRDWVTVPHGGWGPPSCVLGGPPRGAAGELMLDFERHANATLGPRLESRILTHGNGQLLLARDRLANVT